MTDDIWKQLSEPLPDFERLLKSFGTPQEYILPGADVLKGGCPVTREPADRNDLPPND